MPNNNSNKRHSLKNRNNSKNIKRNSKNIKPNKKSNKKRKRKSFIIKSLILLGLAIILFCVGTLAVVHSKFNKLDNTKIDKGDLGIVSKEELNQYSEHEKIKNIALFGIDSEDGNGRSDSIIIATIDPVHDKLKITSIMRDTYVSISGHGNDKINHAYAYGGPQLAIKTLNENFGINIEDFVSVDFASLPKIIDLLGGIELNITSEEINCSININDHIDHINKEMGTNTDFITTPGLQKVNGFQALAYSRIRYTAGGDSERTTRQRIVINKLFEKALSVSPTQYLGLVDKILPFIKTSLNSNDILSLATKVVTIGGHELEQERFPRDGYYWDENINGIYYLGFDADSTKQQIMDYIFDDK